MSSHIRRVVIALVLSTPAVGLYQQGQNGRQSIRDAKEKELRVQLLDARTTKPIAGTEVKVYSDNGIRCEQPPCPTNGKEWKGRTDAAGYVTIPRTAIQVVANISTSRHSADLIEDAKRARGGGWVVELVPEDSTQDLPPVPLKLVDAKSGRALANVTARIDFPTESGGRDHVEMRTNSLGYLIIDFTPANARLFAESSQLTVAGYKPVHFEEIHRPQTLVLVPR